MKKGSRDLSRARDAQVLAEYDAGARPAELARKYQTSTPHINQMLKRARERRQEAAQ